MNSGWIKIHRKVLEWEWYQDETTFRVFIHLLLTVNHEVKKWRGITILPGQRVTGRIKLSEELKLGQQRIRTALDRLKSTNNITITSTPNYSIITIQKWKDYQENPKNNQQTNQRLTTTKEVKKLKKTSYASHSSEKGKKLIGEIKAIAQKKTIKHD